MNARDVASVPLGVGGLTYNWWHPIIAFMDGSSHYVIPTLGGILIVLQIIYYWKQIHK